jgi:hypothetical protein
MKTTRCETCKYRSVEVCDKFGVIPVEFIVKSNSCESWEPLDTGHEVLSRWIGHAKTGTIERQWIEAMLNAITLKSIDPCLSSAINWVYGLPDSFDVRALRETVAMIDVDYRRHPF